MTRSVLALRTLSSRAVFPTLIPATEIKQVKPVVKQKGVILVESPQTGAHSNRATRRDGDNTALSDPIKQQLLTSIVRTKKARSLLSTFKQQHTAKRLFSSKEVQWGCLETAEQLPGGNTLSYFLAPRINLLLDVASGSPAVGPRAMQKSVDFTARRSMTVHEITQPISLSVLA